jgi:aldose sugar dehydrogenase
MRFSQLLAAVVVFSNVAVAQELPRDAEKLYAQLCASCHGANLEGGSGSNLRDAAWKHGAGDDAVMERIIAAGLPANGMPAFGETVDAARRRALIVFLRERATRAQEKNTTYAKPADTTEIVRSEVAAFRIETLVEGLEVPWSLAFLPGSTDVLIAERAGDLRVVRAGQLLPEPIRNTPRVWAQGQGGLMIVKPHPDYAKNGWLYLAFSDPGPDGSAMTAIVRGRIRDGAWVDQEDIFRAPRALYKKGTVHFGTRLVFDSGYLYFGIGERGAQNDAQDLSRPNGKIHRLHDDGRIPSDNPFVATADALPSIWSYGHRNPQGIAARPGTTGPTLQLWETEHGPRGGDELNLIQRGANFGWPLVTFGMNYNGTPVSPDTARPGLVPPVTYWTPSIAVCGLDFYDGARFPAWQGNLFVGSLAQQELRRLVLEGDTVKAQEVLFRGVGRIRAVQQGPDGLLYVCLEQPGRIIRLVPAE